MLGSCPQTAGLLKTINRRFSALVGLYDAFWRPLRRFVVIKHAK